MENEDKLAWDPMTASLLAPLAVSDRPVFRNRNWDVFEGTLPLPCYSRYCFSWCHTSSVLVTYCAEIRQPAPRWH